MKKPIIVERNADNGEFSHYALIDSETQELLWSEAPEEEVDKVKNNIALDCVSKCVGNEGKPTVCTKYADIKDCPYKYAMVEGCFDCENFVRTGC